MTRKRLDRDPLHLFDHAVGEVGRDDEIHAALVVLRGVVVPLVSERDDLARDGRDRVAVAEHADFDLDPVEELLHEHLVVVAECQQHRLGELALVVGLRDPDRRSEPGGLDEAREPEGVLHRISLAEREVPRDGKPAVPEHLLEEVLVHAESRSRDTGADVRDTGELEQSLDGAVLPNGPWRIGSTTSTAPRVAGAFAAGTGSVSAIELSSPAPSSQRPSRPIATVTTS